MSISIDRSMDRSTSRSTSRRRTGASRSLDDLTRRLGVLWGVEPQLSPLVPRASSGNSVAIDEIRSCKQCDLWLRERWAAPSPEGRAA